jgi:hypothetical protein
MLANWQNKGFDTHSLVADPLFTNAAQDDYSLKPESPAFKLGFVQIETQGVGVRAGKGE